MALNKRKVLDAAQKYLQKGNLDRALKEYQKVVDADPKDSNVRLKVGDVQLRKGNSEAAIDAYLGVAHQFMKDGFDAKAVALFKQITKIDEKRYDIYEPLAELYQRLSLTSEAMSALQTAAEAHQRDGRKKEGLALLRKMASLDPSNTATRIKIADMLWKEELQEESLAEYDEVVAELGRQDDHESVVRVHQQVLKSLPERIENLIGLGLAHLELNQPQKAEVPLLKATEVAVDSIEAWEGLARVHEALGRRKDLEDAWKTVAAIHKDRGNDEKAKEILQLYVTPQGLTEDGEQEFDDETGGVTLGELGADPIEDLDIGSDVASEPVVADAAKDAPEIDLDDEIEIELDEEVDVDSDDPDESSLPDVDIDTDADEEAPADADPAQLLAEAGVYLRYSQHDKAVQCLERILENVPGHLEALERLGEAREAMGDRDAAIRLWKEGAEHARRAGDQGAFDTLCERIRGLDEGTADALAADALAPSLDDEPSSDADLDLELEFDTPSGEPEVTGEVSSMDLEIDLLDAGPPPTEAAPDAALDFDAVEASAVEDTPEPSLADDEVDVAIDDEELDVDAAVEELDVSISDDELDVSISDDELDVDMTDDGPELDVADADESEVRVDADEPEAPVEKPAPAAAESETPATAPRFDVPAGSVRIDGSASGEVPAEDLEEAEFYFRQGLLDEAEQILKRLLTVAPGHPQVLLRLGEIAKSKGESPSTPVASDVDFDRTEDDTHPGLDTASESTIEDLGGVPSVGEPPAGPDDETIQVDPDDLEDVEYEEEEAGVTLGSMTAPSLEAVQAAVEPESEAESGEGFDLAAELEDVFDDTGGSAGPEESVGGTTQAGFQSIFQSFKAGVKETLGEGEYETHYDLGIAYREMGLFDDAIGEFAAALPSPTRKLDCLAMMGVCALDLGRAEDAVAHLEQALATPDLEEDMMAGLRFDLGRAFAMKSDWGRARSLWEQVKAFDPDFQDVSTRLEELGEESAPSLGVLDPSETEGSGEALESFDDLIAEAESGFDGDDDDDDPDEGPDGSGSDDSSGDMGSTKWGGRKISYG